LKSHNPFYFPPIFYFLHLSDLLSPFCVCSVGNLVHEKEPQVPWPCSPWASHCPLCSYSILCLSLQGSPNFGTCCAASWLQGSCTHGSLCLKHSSHSLLLTYLFTLEVSGSQICVCMWRGLYPQDKKRYWPGRLQNILQYAGQHSHHRLIWLQMSGVLRWKNFFLGLISGKISLTQSEFLFFSPKVLHCFPQSTHLSVVMHHLRIGTTSILLAVLSSVVGSELCLLNISLKEGRRKGAGGRQRKRGSEIHLCFMSSESVSSLLI